MDTSETYIKMCEKAEEIQKLFRTVNPDMPHIDVTQHDYIYCPKHKSLWHTTPSGCLCVNYELCTVVGIWLPRQDELQEMLDDRFSNHYPWILAEKFAKEVNQNWAASMEQLWLAFVLKEKFNKVWDAGKWVNADL